MKMGIYSISPNRNVLSKLTKNMKDDTESVCDGTFFWVCNVGIPVNSQTIGSKKFVRNIGEGKNWDELPLN